MKKKKKLPSVKGGASIDFQRCNVRKADQHNHRTGPITNPNIRPELTPNNYNWDDPDVPDLKEYDRAIKEDYFNHERSYNRGGKTIKYHKKMPSKGRTKCFPIREGVLNLPSNSPETIKMVDDFAKKVEMALGWKCIRKSAQFDEVYVDPDANEERVNCHAHLIFDTYCWERHVCLHANQKQFSYSQDLASESTGMERGRKKSLTGAKHLNPYAYKSQMERERCESLRKIKEELERESDDLILINRQLADANNAYRRQVYEDQYKNSQDYAKVLLATYNKFSKVVDPNEEGQNAYTHLEELVQEDYRQKSTDSLKRLLESLALAIKSMADIINRMTSLIKQKNLSLYSTYQSAKLLSFLVPKEANEELLEAQKYKRRAEEAEKAKERAISKANEIVNVVYKRARINGIELDEASTRNNILTRVKAELNFASLPPLDIEKLMNSDIIIVSAGDCGYRYQVLYNYYSQDIELRVYDSVTMEKAGWSHSMAEANRKHQEVIDKIFFEKKSGKKQSLGKGKNKKGML